jgi:hypothetical protein
VGIGVNPAIYLQNNQISLAWLGATGGSWTSADTTPVSDGQWHHIAVSLNKGQITVYKDGVATADSFTADSSTLFNGGVNFGGGAWNGIPSFIGQMWNGEVWASASSASDIQAQMFPNYNGNYPSQLRLLTSFDSTAGTATNLVTPSITARLNGVTVSSATLPFEGQYPTASEQVTISLQDSGGNTVATTTPNFTTNGVFSAAIPMEKIAAGKYQINYSYAGNSVLLAPPNWVTNVTVNPATQFGNLAFSPEVIDVGTNIQASGNITAGTIIPTGNVSISVSNDSQQASGSAMIKDDGSFSTTVNTSSLGPGVYTVNYVFAATSEFSGVSNSNGRLTVNKTASSTSLSATPNPSSPGQQVTFTATVTGTGGTPSGTVTFSDGGTTLGTGTLINGATTYQTTSLSAGSHTITATYNGDSNFGTSSGTVTQVVKTTSSTSMSATPNPSSPGQQVTFTATVTGTGGTPSGTVTFSEGGTTLGTGTLTNGVASYQTTSLSAGSNTIAATYNGDSSFAPSSGTVTQVVNGQIQPQVTLIASPNPTPSDQAITLTATVSTPQGSVPVGNVSFSETAGSASYYYGNVDVVNGVATLVVDPNNLNPQWPQQQQLFVPGSHQLFATYGAPPNSNYLSNHSDAYSLTITGGVRVGEGSKGVQLLTVVTLSKLTDGTYQAGISTRNNGTITASAVQLTGFSLGSVNASGLPISMGDIPPGSTGVATLLIPVTVGPLEPPLSLESQARIAGAALAVTFDCSSPDSRSLPRRYPPWIERVGIVKPVPGSVIRFQRPYPFFIHRMSSPERGKLSVAFQRRNLVIAIRRKWGRSVSLAMRIAPALLCTKRLV